MRNNIFGINDYTAISQLPEDDQKDVVVQRLNKVWEKNKRSSIIANKLVIIAEELMAESALPGAELPDDKEEYYKKIKVDKNNFIN